jgi:preprotein translocase SecE subunit
MAAGEGPAVAGDDGGGGAGGAPVDEPAAAPAPAPPRSASRTAAPEKARARAAKAPAKEPPAKERSRAKQQPARREPRGGSRVMAFFRNVWAELRRVQWPDRSAVTQATAVVVVFCFAAGLYLAFWDFAFNKLVKALL